MNGNDRQTAKPENKENYEAAVLDFLDKEMASVQPIKKGKEQSDDLDALVSDLLQQVITESDEPKGNRAASDEINKLISELAPLREVSSPPDKKAAPSNPHKEPSQAEGFYSAKAAPKDAAGKPAVLKSQAKAAATAKASIIPAASFFANILANKNRVPIIAAALVCLLLAIGIPVYFIKGSSTPAPKPSATQPVAAPVVPAAATQAVPTPVQSTGRTKAAQATAPASSSKSAVVEASRSTSAAQAQKQLAQAQKQAAPVIQPAATPVNVPAPAPAREERPAVAQAAPPVAPPVAPVTPIAAPEKPAMQVVAENAAPARLVVDKAAAPRISGNPAGDSAPLELQTPAPVHVVPKLMMPAVPVSQVSPKYPELALRSRSSGSIVLELEIDSNGKVTRATAVSGPELFHKEAINAVMKWRYKPATVGGSNVPSQSKVTLNFNLPK